MQETAIDTRAPASDDIRSVVVAAIEATAQAQEKALQPLVDDLLLAESGLDSLCFAIIVAQLEDELGVDPFSTLNDAFFPVTFGEFVGLYEAAARGGAS